MDEELEGSLQQVIQLPSAKNLSSALHLLLEFACREKDVETTRRGLRIVMGNCWTVEDRRHVRGKLVDTICVTKEVDFHEMTSLILEEIPFSAEPEESDEDYGSLNLALLNLMKEQPSLSSKALCCLKHFPSTLYEEELFAAAIAATAAMDEAGLAASLPLSVHLASTKSLLNEAWCHIVTQLLRITSNDTAYALARELQQGIDETGKADEFMKWRQRHRDYEFSTTEIIIIVGWLDDANLAKRISSLVNTLLSEQRFPFESLEGAIQSVFGRTASEEDCEKINSCFHRVSVLILVAPLRVKVARFDNEKVANAAVSVFANMKDEASRLSVIQSMMYLLEVSLDETTDEKGGKRKRETCEDVALNVAAVHSMVLDSLERMAGTNITGIVPLKEEMFRLLIKVPFAECNVRKLAKVIALACVSDAKHENEMIQAVQKLLFSYNRMRSDRNNMSKSILLLTAMIQQPKTTKSSVKCIATCMDRILKPQCSRMLPLPIGQAALEYVKCMAELEHSGNEVCEAFDMCKMIVSSTGLIQPLNTVANTDKRHTESFLAYENLGPVEKNLIPDSKRLVFCAGYYVKRLGTQEHPSNLNLFHYVYSMVKLYLDLGTRRSSASRKPLPWLLSCIEFSSPHTSFSGRTYSYESSESNQIANAPTNAHEIKSTKVASVSLAAAEGIYTECIVALAVHFAALHLAADDTELRAALKAHLIRLFAVTHSICLLNELYGENSFIRYDDGQTSALPTLHSRCHHDLLRQCLEHELENGEFLQIEKFSFVRNLFACLSLSYSGITGSNSTSMVSLCLRTLDTLFKKANELNDSDEYRSMIFLLLDDTVALLFNLFHKYSHAIDIKALSPGFGSVQGLSEATANITEVIFQAVLRAHTLSDFASLRERSLDVLVLLASGSNSHSLLDTMIPLTRQSLMVLPLSESLPSSTDTIESLHGGSHGLVSDKMKATLTLSLVQSKDPSCVPFCRHFALIMKHPQALDVVKGEIDIILAYLWNELRVVNSSLQSEYYDYKASFSAQKRLACLNVSSIPAVFEVIVAVTLDVLARQDLSKGSDAGLFSDLEKAARLYHHVIDVFVTANSLFPARTKRMVYRFMVEAARLAVVHLCRIQEWRYSQRRSSKRSLKNHPLSVETFNRTLTLVSTRIVGPAVALGKMTLENNRKTAHYVTSRTYRSTVQKLLESLNKLASDHNLPDPHLTMTGSDVLEDEIGSVFSLKDTEIVTSKSEVNDTESISDVDSLITTSFGVSGNWGEESDNDDSTSKDSVPIFSTILRTA